MAVRVWLPAVLKVVFQVTAYGAVRSSTAVPLSSLKDTAATPTLSLALAVIVTVPLRVELLEGEVMLTKGGVVSVAGVTVTGVD